MCNNTKKVKIPFPKISFFIISSYPSLILFLFYSVIVSVLENPSLDPIHFCSISFTSHFTSHFISFSYPPNPFHHLFHNVTLTYLSNHLAHFEVEIFLKPASHYSPNRPCFPALQLGTHPPPFP